MSSSNDTSAMVATLAAQMSDLQTALDTFFVLSSATLVFMMQLGMALLQVGGVRATNCKNVAMQTILTTCIASMMWWFVGFGIFEGRYNDGIGSLNNVVTNSPSQFAVFFFFWGFDAASSAIISCAITSRVLFTTYIVACALYSGLVFPIAAYCVWGRGFFTEASGDNWVVLDFAGGLPVHTVGGLFAVVGAYIIGPRYSRFAKDEKGEWQDNREPGHSVLFQTIGTMLLWFGWFGFNGGSGLALSNAHYLVASRAAINSLIAPSIAGLVMTAYMIRTRDVHDLVEFLNGLLCGLVAITPACATVPTWGAVIIGATSVFPYLLGTRILSRLRIDDILDAFPVHGMCGIWGTICAALFSQQELIDDVFGPGVINFSVGRQLGIQLFGTVVCGAFAIASSVIIFTALKCTVGLRVTEADERVGLDFKYHAGYAYPDINQRVKRAHEQIQMEAELAAQVRKQVLQGKESRLRDASHAAPTKNLKHVPSTVPRHSIDRRSGNKGDSRQKGGVAAGAADGATGRASGNSRDRANTTGQSSVDEQDGGGGGADAENGGSTLGGLSAGAGALLGANNVAAGAYAMYMRPAPARRHSLTSSSASSFAEPSFNSVHYRKAHPAPSVAGSAQDSNGVLRPPPGVNMAVAPHHSGGGGGGSAAAAAAAGAAAAGSAVASSGSSGTTGFGNDSGVKRPLIESGQFHRRAPSSSLNGAGGTVLVAAASNGSNGSGGADNGGSPGQASTTGKMSITMTSGTTTTTTPTTVSGIHANSSARSSTHDIAVSTMSGSGGGGTAPETPVALVALAASASAHQLQQMPFVRRTSSPSNHPIGGGSTSNGNGNANGNGNGNGNSNLNERFFALRLSTSMQRPVQPSPDGVGSSGRVGGGGGGAASSNVNSSSSTERRKDGADGLDSNGANHLHLGLSSSNAMMPTSPGVTHANLAAIPSIPSTSAQDEDAHHGAAAHHPLLA